MRASRSARAAVVLVAAGAGALAAVGFLLAGLFELQGFGAPRDEGPRTGYLAGLALGLGVAIGGPLLLWRALLPGSAPGWALAAAPLLAAVLLVLGIGLGR